MKVTDSVNLPWHKNFTEREIKTIRACSIYGSDKELQKIATLFSEINQHDVKMIIAKMAVMLEDKENEGCFSLDTL